MPQGVCVSGTAASQWCVLSVCLSVRYLMDCSFLAAEDSLYLEIRVEMSLGGHAPRLGWWRLAVLVTKWTPPCM